MLVSIRNMPSGKVFDDSNRISIKNLSYKPYKFQLLIFLPKTRKWQGDYLVISNYISILFAESTHDY